jgi:hypothetical protein
VISLKKFYSVTISLLILTISTSTWATPIVFEFKGTVTNTVTDIISGDNGAKDTTRPEWNGQQVTGFVTLELHDEWKMSSDADPYTIFRTFASAADAEWMQIKLRNPDGTYFDSSLATGGGSSPYNPYPDSAYTQIIHQYDDFYSGSLTNLGINRRYYDSTSLLSNNYFELSLIGNGDNASQLASSKNYNDVIIKSEFANLQNFGRVIQSDQTLNSPNYYFSVDSFSRVRTDVPEPSIPLLLFSGLAILLIKRLKLFS